MAHFVRESSKALVYKRKYIAGIMDIWNIDSIFELYIRYFYLFYLTADPFETIIMVNELNLMSGFTQKYKQILEVSKNVSPMQANHFS